MIDPRSLCHDRTAAFSESQPITDTSNSINVLYIWKGLVAFRNLFLHIDTDFVGGESLEVILQSDTKSIFNNPRDRLQSIPIVTKKLVKHYLIPFERLPEINELYIRLKYKTVGKFIKGTITAVLFPGDEETTINE